MVQINIFMLFVSVSLYHCVLALPVENSTSITSSTSAPTTSQTFDNNSSPVVTTESSTTTTTTTVVPLENNFTAASNVVSVTVFPSILPIPEVSTSSSTVKNEEKQPVVIESRAIEGTLGNGNKTEDTNPEFDGPIRRCNYNGNTDVNKCLRQILDDLKPRLGAGIPEIGLPPMDPLYLNTVSFHHGSGPIKILATFKDVNCTGLSTFDRSDFTFDVKKRILDFDLSIPQMRIVGNYELSGNLFFFPIGGNGGFWLNLGGIRAKGQGKLGVSAKNNLKSIQIKKIDIDLEIETIKVHLTNLFNGDQLLGTVINNFLNENSKDIFEEIRPQIGIQVGEMVQLLSNKALGSLSSDHFGDIRVDSEK